MKIRDRVKELRRVKAGELRPHPKNWRVHPQAQRAQHMLDQAMRAATGTGTNH